MGQVYEAEDVRLGRRVAIKVMSASLVDDPVHRARFMREAKVAASVSHPNLAALYDVGEDPDGAVWWSWSWRRAGGSASSWPAHPIPGRSRWRWRWRTRSPPSTPRAWSTAT